MPFYCTAEAAQDAADAFPWNRTGGGNEPGGSGDGGGVVAQDAPDRGNRRNREGRGNKRNRADRGEGEEHAGERGRGRAHGRRN